MLPDIETRLYRLLSSLDLRPTLERAAEIGRLLRDARPSVPYGEWVGWLKRFHLSKQSAGDYIQVANILEAEPEVVRPAGRVGIKPFLEQWRRARKEARLAERREWVDGLPKAKTVPGLHCGDSLQVMRRMAEGSVSAAICDPPFGIGLTYDGWTEPDEPEEYWTWFRPYWEEMCRVVAPGGIVAAVQGVRHMPYLYQWYGSDIWVHARTAVVRARAMWTPVVVWQRPGGTPAVRMHLYEGWAILTLTTDADQLALTSQHPCPMSAECARALIQRYSRQGDTVLDPFMGVASLGVAAREMERGYIGIERSRRYYTLAKRRLTPPS